MAVGVALSDDNSFAKPVPSSQHKQLPTAYLSSSVAGMNDQEMKNPDMNLTQPSLTSLLLLPASSSYRFIINHQILFYSIASNNSFV